jgi:hypothetical protein
LTNPLTALARRLAGPIIRKILTGKIRAAAEGRSGERAKKLYWSLKGHKTAVGLGFGAAFAVLAALGEPWAQTAILFVAAPLVGGGLLDKGWNTDVPALTDNALWRLLADHSAELSFGLSLLWWESLNCSSDLSAVLTQLHLNCLIASKVAASLAAIAVFLGLGDASLKAPPPQRPVMGDRP